MEISVTEIFKKCHEEAENADTQEIKSSFLCLNTDFQPCSDKKSLCASETLTDVCAFILKDIVISFKSSFL